MESERLRGADSNDSLRKAGEVIGIILAFVFFMVVLRWLINTTIDLAVLGEASSLTRFLSQIRRLFCPWFHPRTEPEEQLTAATVQVHNADRRGPATETLMAQMMEGLTGQERYLLLASLLSAKPAGKDDLNLQKDRAMVTVAESSEIEHAAMMMDHDEDCNSDTTNQTVSHSLCPICIHEILLADEIILSKCKHLFHSECLVQWLSTNTRDCPSCRTQLVTEDILNKGLQLRREALCVTNLNQTRPSTL